MESTFLNQQDYIAPLNFSTEIIRFLQISQGTSMHPREKYKRAQPPVDGEKIVATEPTLWPVASPIQAQGLGASQCDERKLNEDIGFS